MIKVRELTHKDIPLIIDYWHNSSEEFMHAMGAEKSKLPSRDAFSVMLSNQLVENYDQKSSYALIWEYNHQPIGHSNVNNIKFGQEATMHLHLWDNAIRKQGLGQEFVRKSLPFYFDNLHLQKIICEPFADNLAPNKTLQKVGFTFIKKYSTIPGNLNFEQEVNRWEMNNKH